MCRASSALSSGERWKNGLAHREVEPHHRQLGTKTSKTKPLSVLKLTVHLRASISGVYPLVVQV